nr:hypothetical protein [Myxococcota bacterium]
MNEKLKETITQKLDDLDDEHGRQLLDYMEFLESKHNRSTRTQTTFERIAENVEGTLRGSRLGDAAIKGTEGILDAAGTVAKGVAAAGQAVLDELQQVTGDPVSTEEPESNEEAAKSSSKPGSSEDSE